MKVICPKCHYENQASGTRIVCGRCATLIEVQLSSGGGRGSVEEPPEHRQTTRLRRGATGGADEPRRAGRSTRDPYATSIGGDFGDVLDLNATPSAATPLDGQSAAASEYERQTDPLTGDLWNGRRPTKEKGKEGEEGEEGQNGESRIDRSISDSVRDPSLPLTAASEIGDPPAAWMGREGGFFEPGSERETRDYFEPPDLVGDNWPLTTENGPTGSLEGGDGSSSDRGEFSGGRQGMFLRFLLGAIVFASLIGGAYLFLGDLIRSRQDVESLSSTEETAQNTPQESRTSGRLEVTAPTPTVAPSPKEGTVGPSGNSTPPGPNQEPTESSAIDILPMTGRGGPVEPVKATPAAAPKSPAASGPWTIQVAAYADEAQANARRQGLQSRGMVARVVRAELPGKGTWYRVQVGDFPTREAGMVFGRDLRAKGVISDFLVSSTRP